MSDPAAPLRAFLAREERSASWLARRMGVDPSLVTKVLRGSRRPTADFRRRASAALSLPEEAIFFPVLVDGAAGASRAERP